MGSQKYWDENYKDGSFGDTYDWYGSGTEFGLRDLLTRAGVDRGSRILHVGCGNSEVIESLWRDGFKHVTHMDISPVVIEQLTTRMGFTGHTFVVGDMLALDFEDAAFDAVLDKGALDAILTSGKPRARKAILEIARVLRPVEGRYVMMSLGEPARRLNDLEWPSAPWSHRRGEGDRQTFVCEMEEIETKRRTTIGTIYTYICRWPTPGVPAPTRENAVEL